MNFPSFVFFRNENSPVETEGQTSNVEHRTSNAEVNDDSRLPFDVRRWTFDVRCSSGFVESLLSLLRTHWDHEPDWHPSPCPLPARRGEGGRRPGEGRFMGEGIDQRHVMVARSSLFS